MATIAAVTAGVETETVEVAGRWAAVAWGANSAGQLCVGDNEDRLAPTESPGLSILGIAQLACGAGHVLLVTQSGRVLSWGWGKHGVLGHGDDSERRVPTPITGLRHHRVRSVAAGWMHSFALTPEGELTSWGQGSSGQLGLGDCKDRAVPERVNGLPEDGICSVSAGMRHSLAIDSNGVLFGWGDSTQGRLGPSFVSHEKLRPSPTRILGPPHRIRMASAGAYHSAAVDMEGSVWTWGRDSTAQLGRVGPSEDPAHVGPNQSIPQRVPGLANALEVICSWSNTAVLGTAGEVYICGACSLGQLGDAGAAPAPTHAWSRVALPPVRQLRAGSEHFVAITAEREVFTWGWAEHGQLGTGNTQNQSIPCRLPLAASSEGAVDCGPGYSILSASLKRHESRSEGEPELA